MTRHFPSLFFRKASVIQPACEPATPAEKLIEHVVLSTGLPKKEVADILMKSRINCEGADPQRVTQAFQLMLAAKGRRAGLDR